MLIYGDIYIYTYIHQGYEYPHLITSPCLVYHLVIYTSISGYEWDNGAIHTYIHYIYIYIYICITYIHTDQMINLFRVSKLGHDLSIALCGPRMFSPQKICACLRINEWFGILVNQFQGLNFMKRYCTLT